MRLREGKGPVWGPSGAEAGTGGVEARRWETLRGEGGGEAPCRPCQGLLPALLPGSGNRLKENRKGEKESKQTQRKAWSSERSGCLVWRSHLPGHSQPFCRQTPATPTTQGVCTLMHKHTHTQIQISRHIDMHIHRHVCVYRHTHTHIHTHTQGTYSHAQMQGTEGLRMRGVLGMEGFHSIFQLTHLAPLTPQHTQLSPSLQLQ